MISKSVLHGKYNTLFDKRLLGVLLSFLIVVLAQADWSIIACALTATCGISLFFESIQGYNYKKKFILSVIWMGAVQFVQQNWIMTPTYTGPIVFLALPLHALSYGLIFGLIAVWVKKELNSLSVLAVASSWVVLDQLRPWLFFGLGFAWNPLGLTLCANNLSLQLASVVGVLGLSFWVTVTNLAVFCRKRWAIFMAVFPYLFGFFWIQTHERGFLNSPTITALIVQQAKSPWQSEAYIWHELMELLQPWKNERPDLVVLSEGGLPRDAQQSYIPIKAAASMLVPYLGYYHHAKDPEALISNTHMMEAWMQGWPVNWIVGMSDDQGSRGCFNGAFLFSKDRSRQVYHKQFLLPFGEYLPFCFRWVRSFLPIDPGFARGEKVTLFEGSPNMGVSICYEETVSHLSYQQRKKGAQLLVGLTNDVWYPFSRLPITHYYHARVRAVELGLPMIRACNTGVSCVIDSLGRNLGQLPFEKKNQKAEKSVLKITIPLFHFQTIYSFYGDLLVWVWLLLTIVGYGYQNRSKIFTTGNNSTAGNLS